MQMRATMASLSLYCVRYVPLCAANEFNPAVIAPVILFRFPPTPPRNSLVDRRVLSIVQSTAFIFVARQPENARIIGASSRRSTFPLAGVRAGRGGAGRGGEE